MRPRPGWAIFWGLVLAVASAAIPSPTLSTAAAGGACACFATAWLSRRYR